jgi:hypothetical protein
MEGAGRIVLIQIDELEVVEAVNQTLVGHPPTQEHAILGLKAHRVTTMQFL